MTRLPDMPRRFLKITLGIGLLIILAHVGTGCRGCGDKQTLKAKQLVQEGVAMEQKGQYSDAATSYRLAIATDPSCREAYFQLGTLSERLGTYPQAEMCYRHAIALGPDAIAYNNLGNVLGSQGKLVDAIAAYRQTIQLDPSLPSGHYNLGQSLILAHQFDEAETELRRAVELQPDEFRYNDALGRLFKNSGKPELALPFLERCQALDSSRTELNLTLADVYESLQMFDKAIQTLEHCLLTLTDRETKGLLKTRLRELRMRQTDSRKRTLRS